MANDLLTVENTQVVEPNLFTEATGDLQEAGVISTQEDAVQPIIEDEQKLAEREASIIPMVEPQAEDTVPIEQPATEPTPTTTTSPISLEEATEMPEGTVEQKVDGTLGLTDTGLEDLGVSSQITSIGRNALKAIHYSDEQIQQIYRNAPQEVLDKINKGETPGFLNDYLDPKQLDSAGNPLASDIAEYNSQMEDLAAEFNTYNVDTDPAFIAMAQNIRDQFAQTRLKTERINKSRAAALQTKGLRRGTAQFAGAIQLGIEGEELIQANQRINEINTAESAAISAARQAFESSEWNEFSKKMEVLDTLRDNKAEELENYNKALVETNKKLDEKNKEIKEEVRGSQIRNGVLSAINAGITDPLTILSALEANDIQATPEEVTQYTSLISNNDFISNLSPSIQDFKLLEKNDPKFLDSIGISKNPDGSFNYKEYLSVVNGAKNSIENDLDKLLTPNQLTLFNAPAGSTMRDVLGQVPKTELTGTQKFTEENNLAKQFESLVGDSRKAATQIGIIRQSGDAAEAAVKEGTSLNAASQGVFVAFQKLLDPQSVVRESEYARSGDGQSLWNRMQGTWQKLEQGGAGATIEEIRNFVNMAETYLGNYEADALKHANRMKLIAEQRGLNLGSILTEDMIDLIDEGEATQEIQASYESLGFDESYEEAVNLYGEDGVQRIIDSQGGTTEPFNQDLGTSQNFLGNFGQVTGFGSPLWKHGLDLDLKIGDPVPSPVSGTVEFVGNNGGFGNQVRIVTSQGNTVWLSHLKSSNLKKGQKISKGQVVGKGGNTGRTIPGPGGDGSHLDLTVKKSDGTFFTPKEIYNQLA